MELQIIFQQHEENVALGETLEATPLGNNLFRLEHNSLFNEEIHYGDVIEFIRQEDNSWRFVRLVESSGWQHFNRILSKSLVQSELFQLWLESITERGGFWEVACGGIVFISYPPNSQIDVEAEVQELVAKTNQ